MRKGTRTNMPSSHALPYASPDAQATHRVKRILQSRKRKEYEELKALYEREGKKGENE